MRPMLPQEVYPIFTTVYWPLALVALVLDEKMDLEAQSVDSAQKAIPWLQHIEKADRHTTCASGIQLLVRVALSR